MINIPSSRIYIQTIVILVVLYTITTNQHSDARVDWSLTHAWASIIHVWSCLNLKRVNKI